MRRLGPVEHLLPATINLGTNTTGSTTKALLAKVWKEHDLQLAVFSSILLQLFLLLAGNVRRTHRAGVLSFFVWLAYLASYTVAASAIGLFSQYEDKYKLRSCESSEDLYRLTLPFLWPPFLLLHLGGQDTITAFSIEDNDLWMRQVINFYLQLTLAMYVFWKSMDILKLNSKLLAIAVPLFIAGIVKCGERIWALQRGSRGSLDCHKKKDDLTSPVEGPSQLSTRTSSTPIDAVASPALKSALCCRGLLVGRTLVQLGSGAAIVVLDAFAEVERAEAKIEFVLTELGMIYDMLYTKTMVLQKWKGRLFRCIALVAMVVSFVLFWANQHPHDHQTSNAIITYMLFVGTIFMEVFSIFTLIASPWTRARSKLLGWLSRKLVFFFPTQNLPSPSMRQFNLTHYCLNKKPLPKFTSKVFRPLGLQKHWRNIWHVKGMVDNLMAVYPSMLRVGSAAQDFESIFSEWVRGNRDNLQKTEILKKYVSEKLCAKNSLSSPFKETPSVETLNEIKEVWARLLIYAAGKCPMELHARQLGNEVELLTVVGYLMMHYGFGDVGRELKLLAPPLGLGERETRERWVSVHENESINMIPPEEPLYAFEFLQDREDQPMYVQAWGLERRNENQMHPSTSHGTDEAAPGPSVRPRSTAQQSTSDGIEVALDTEQAGGHHRRMPSKSLSARGIAQLPQASQTRRASSIG